MRINDNNFTPWVFIKDLFITKSKVNQILQDLELITSRYRDTALLSGRNIVELNDDVIDQLYQTSVLKDKVNQLGEEMSEGEKQSLLVKIEGIKKGLMEMERQCEKEMKSSPSGQESFAILRSASFKDADKAMGFVNRFLSLHELAHQPPDKLERRSAFPQQRSFTKRDIEELDSVIASLKKYVTESPAEQKAIGLFLKELESGRHAIQEALDLRTELLKQLRMGLPKISLTVQDLLKKIQRKPRNDLKELEMLTFKKLADLYWGFNPPFGIRISLEDYLQIKGEPPIPATGLDSLISLDTYTKLTPTELIEMQKGTFARLKRMRGKNMTPNMPHVTIVGGGPGGLARALVAAASGAKWEVIEKRARKDRKNVVKIEDTETLKLLLYFGAQESLLLSDSASLKYRALSGYSLFLPIGQLEESLAQSLSALSDENGKVTLGEVVDVRSDQTVTEVLIKGQDTPTKTDLIVFADGAKSVGAKIVAIERELFSTPTMMFGISMENCKQITKPSKEPYVPLKEGIQFDFVVINGTIGKSAYATVSVKEESAILIGKRQNEAWYKENAVHFMKWLGYQGGEIVLARPFNVVIGKAEKAAATQGNALILSSGDAYATPDPAASLGCALAIRSAIQFSDALRSWEDKKEHALIQEEQNYGMEIVYDEFIRASFAARNLYAGKDTKEAIAVVRQAKLPKEMTAGLNLAFQKHAAGAAYTKEDREWLEEAERLTKREPFRMPENAKDLPDKEKMALWKQLDAHQKESWKEWLNAKIHEALENK